MECGPAGGGRGKSQDVNGVKLTKAPGGKGWFVTGEGRTADLPRRREGQAAGNVRSVGGR